MFTRQQFIEPGLFRRLDQTHADLPQQHGFLRQSLNDCLRKMNRHALTQTNPQRLRQQIPLKPLSLNPYCYSLTTAVAISEGSWFFAFARTLEEFLAREWVGLWPEPWATAARDDTVLPKNSAETI